MIVILVSKLSNGDVAKTYGGIACDVEGCEAFEPPFDKGDRRESLIARGWFVAPGQHRCPEHFHEETPARGPEHRHTELTTKVL